jgi:iron-sulfur cluster assembly protein
MTAMEIIERPTTLVSLTENAATKIKQLMAEEPEGEAEVLRVAVQGGGCSGFEYALGFDRSVQDGDSEMTVHGVTVVVDPFSAPYVAGAEIDFVDGLQASGFAINNPNVASSCGCGHSFQVADEAADDVVAHGDGCGSGCGH